MALKIKWSKRAGKKLDKILEYLLKEWGEAVATSFIKKVYGLIEILAEFPELGSIEHPENSIRGFTVVRQINIYYKVSNNTLFVLNFFDNRQNPKKKRF